MIQSPVEQNRLSKLEWTVLLVATAILVIFRLHAFDLPLETDVCNYAYIGARLFEGDRLYEGVWDHQPPGVFMLFTATINFFGSSDEVFRWQAVAFSIAALFLVHRFARHTCGKNIAAVAAIAFALVTADPGTAGEGCNREIYMNLCALAALVLLASARLKSLDLILAGSFLAAGSVFKTVVAAQWLALAIWIFIVSWNSADRVQLVLRRITLFGLGPAALWAAVALYFTATNRWSAFIDAVFGFNVRYASLNQSFIARFAEFFTPVFDIFSSAVPLWIAAAIGYPGLIILNWNRMSPAQCLVLAYATGTFLAVCLPGHFWPHYYYLLIPALVLVCAQLLARLNQCFDESKGPRITTAFAIFGTVAILAFQLLHFRLVDPQDITAPHPKYRYRQAWARAQGIRVQSVTDPTDTIFVWGRDAGIYHYANRRCASRFTMVSALEGGGPKVDARRRTLIDELTHNRPRLVLIAEPEFPDLRSFLQSNYILAGPNAVDADDTNPIKSIMIALTDAERPVQPIDWEWPTESNLSTNH